MVWCGDRISLSCSLASCLPACLCLFSVCFWIRMDALSGGYATMGASETIVLAFGDQSSTSNQFSFRYLSTGAPSAAINNVGGESSTAFFGLAGGADRGRWVQYCTTLAHATTTLKLYRNGAPAPGTTGPSVAGMTWTTLTAAAGKIYIGGSGPLCQVSQINDFFGSFMGRLDELRIWRAVVSQPDVLAGYSTNRWITTSLLAYYPFSETYGTTCFDHSGQTRERQSASASEWSRMEQIHTQVDRAN
jgi:hypothetical protein